MAHEIREHDHLMVTKRKAWHGLGTVVEEQQTPNAALKTAKLDWMVEQCPTYCIHDDAGDTKRIPLPNFANIRSDTKEVLGVGSDTYGVVQNSDIADMIWKAADEGACPKVESAGSLKNGRIVFFCCVMESLFIGKGEDEVKPFFTLSTSHDGTRALRGDAHTYRVVCANTDRIARGEAERSGQFVSMRHTSNISNRIAEIRTLFEAVKENVSVYEKKANDLVGVQLTSAKLRTSSLMSTIGSMEPSQIRKRIAASTTSAWTELLNGSTIMSPQLATTTESEEQHGRLTMQSLNGTTTNEQ